MMICSMVSEDWLEADSFTEILEEGVSGVGRSDWEGCIGIPSYHH